MDRTKWYRVNYERLESICIVSGIGRVKMTSSIGSKRPNGSINAVSRANPEVNEGFRTMMCAENLGMKRWK